MASKVKNSWHLSRADAANLLRGLASALEEGGDEVQGYGISLAELIKFKLKIELGQDDTLEVKFEGKGAKMSLGAEFDGERIVHESYSSLKKRMQIYFKALRESLLRAEVPSREIVAVFLADSERMVGYSGYGDEFYAAYAALCVRLREAFEVEDLAAMSQIADELAVAKKTCHARYK